jgi:uncharacterized protein (TIGR02646 family)
MIPVRKGKAPHDLVLEGEEHVKELCAAYEADHELHCTRIRKWTFREEIYRSVQPDLAACHYGKCCYCETPLDANSEVEHWRPKSRYYWLAYSWDNLFLSCGFCNKKKGDAFPLDNPAARAMHHGMSIANETPSILKPDGDQDPREHIKFHGDRPEGLTELGRKTIEVLGLDSPKHGGRLRHLSKIREARKLYMLYVGSADHEKRRHAEIARNLVEQAVRPDEPYSAMIAAYLEANPLPERAHAALNSEDSRGMGG